MKTQVNNTLQTIRELLDGKSSDVVKQFFCGDYFVDTVETNPLFSQLQELVWDAQKKAFNKLSKKIKSSKTLTLKSRVTAFFSTSDLETNKTEIIALQQQILKNWCNYDECWGVSINWNEVLMSAISDGAVNKTQKDFDELKSLQEIPSY